jgi:hypothetical protein
MSDPALSAADRTYREFACWAARRGWEHAKCRPCEDVVLAVERYLRGELAFADVRRLGQERLAEMSDSAAIGLAGGHSSAAAQLAAIHVADASAERSATSVIEWVARAAGLGAVEDHWERRHVTGERPGPALRRLRGNDRLAGSAQATESALLEAELQGRLRPSYWTRAVRYWRR